MPITSKPHLTETIQPERKKWDDNIFVRVSRYFLVRGLVTFLAVVVGLYLSIIIFNFGGYIDQMYKGEIRQAVMGAIMGGWLDDVDPVERDRIVEETIAAREAALGLNTPFYIRSMIYLKESITMQIGGRVGREAIETALPFTAVLVGGMNIIVFGFSVLFSLLLSSKPNSLTNKLISILSPVMFMPSWVFGLILIAIFCGWLGLLPWPSQASTTWIYIRSEPTNFALIGDTFTGMILPALSIFLSTFFLSVYVWRSFFFSFSEGDHVDLAKAIGLKNITIKRKHILRPVLPFVITNFAFMAIGLWQEAIPLEILFDWPGIGMLFMTNVNQMNTRMVMAIIVVFAYLIAITVLLLDVTYALIDPRIRIGNGAGNHEEKSARLYRKRSGLFAGKRRKAVFRNRDLGLSPRKQSIGERIRTAFNNFSIRAGDNRRNVREFFLELFKYPSGVIGLFGILFFIFIAGYTVATIPVDKAIEFWRGQGEDPYTSFWHENPVNVPPVWTNWFSDEKLPPTLIFNSLDKSAAKIVNALTDETTEIVIPVTFDYYYDDFPSAIRLFFECEYDEKLPFIMLSWHTPDGRDIELKQMSIIPHDVYYLDTDEKLSQDLGDVDPILALFGDPNNEGKVLQGRYDLEIKAFVFEPDANVDVKTIFYGQVHGLAGTDKYRRDPMMAILWGTVFTLAFGLLGAVGTSILSMVLAAAGAWFSGPVDRVIQFLSEVNLILPKIIIAIMVSVLYTKSIWVILGVLVLLSIFGNSTKTYRAMFIQTKSAPYVEAAIASGASSWRIIWRYIVPPILPTLVANIMVMIPSYVFYEATLAYLGVSDPRLPTWGKIIYDALINNALLKGYWHQVAIPIGLLVLTGLVFTAFGSALEQILNPVRKV